MKIYWSDRDGNPAPPNCTFYWQPFNAKALLTAPFTFAELPEPKSYKILKKTFLPDKNKWMEMVKRAKSLPKVVLARACILELSEKPDPFAITAALKRKAKGSYVFCLQSEKSAFLGASPERLLARKEGKIYSEAMAGTKAFGKDFEPKDYKELEPIPTFLDEVLSPFCVEKLKFSPLSIHCTSHLQHLYRQCSAKVNPNFSDFKILSELHPTPALCGVPKQKAFSLIEELEPFDRGLYGGFVGWRTQEASEWIVGIRSALIEENKVTLFSGAGIIAESDPEKEWDELDQKLRLYDSILVD